MLKTGQIIYVASCQPACIISGKILYYEVTSLYTSGKILTPDNKVEYFHSTCRPAFPTAEEAFEYIREELCKILDRIDPRPKYRAVFNDTPVKGWSNGEHVEYNVPCTECGKPTGHFSTNANKMVVCMNCKMGIFP